MGDPKVCLDMIERYLDKSTHGHCGHVRGPPGVAPASCHHSRGVYAGLVSWWWDLN